MDQLKKTLAVMKKYYFWILCGLILVAYVSTWFMATSTIDEVTKQQEGKIKGAFQQGQQIQQVSDHPDPGSIEMQQALNRAEAAMVKGAWETRYREQEDVLVWPEELKQDMISVVDQLKPIELTVEYPTTKEIRVDFRNRYRDYIMEEMPKLAEIIGSKWLASPRTSGSGMGGSGMGGYGSGYGSDYGSDYGSSYGSGMGMGMGMGMGGESEYDGGGSESSGYGYGMSGRPGLKPQERPDYRAVERPEPGSVAGHQLQLGPTLHAPVALRPGRPVGSALVVDDHQIHQWRR